MCRERIKDKTPPQRYAKWVMSRYAKRKDRQPKVFFFKKKSGERRFTNERAACTFGQDRRRRFVWRWQGNKAKKSKAAVNDAAHVQQHSRWEELCGSVISRHLVPLTADHNILGTVCCIYAVCWHVFWHGDHPLFQYTIGGRVRVYIYACADQCHTKKKVCDVSPLVLRDNLQYTQIR